MSTLVLRDYLTAAFRQTVPEVAPVIPHERVRFLEEQQRMSTSQRRSITKADVLHYLRVHLANLREKIESSADHPTFLKTESSIGYRFAAE